MTTATISDVVGRGAPTLSLSAEELRVIVAEALDGIEIGERVLAIIPDKTRDDNTDLLFPFAAEVLARRSVAQFDALIAQGTHPPMTRAQKLLKIGFADERDNYFPGELFDHRWDQPEELVTL